MTTTILLGVFFLFLALNVPIAVCLGVASVVVFIVTDMGFSAVPINYYASISKFVLMAIPFFILAGNVMEKAGISTKLIDMARAFVGHYRNGMAIVCVAVSCFFAAISGSGPATVAALGAIVIPAMIASGYPRSSSSALMATSGAIGLIIPPSISFVVFGSITGVSIGELFMAGVFPGILMGVCLILAMVIIARKFALTPLPKQSWGVRIKSFVNAIWALFMPAIILGGIYGGIFTPTEAAAVAAVYGLLVGFFIYRTLDLRGFYKILVDSACQTAVVMFIVSASSLFSYITTVQGIAAEATSLLMSIAAGNKYIFLLIVNILLLLVGCVLDGTCALYLFVPILFPVARSLGVDPVAFGVLMVMNLAIGQVTPPVGVNLYVACGISGSNLKEISIGVVPFVVASLIALFTISYIPQICTFLPYLGR